MSSSGYRVSVALEENHVVLRGHGHLDAAAGRHLIELACLAVEWLERPVQIDLKHMRSRTPAGARLMTDAGVRDLPGRVSLREIA